MASQAAWPSSVLRSLHTGRLLVEATVNATSPAYVTLALEAAAYSAFASAGFLVAVLVAWAILSRLAAGSRPIGNFGKFMVILEAVGSVPEAMVIAEATAGGRMSTSFAFSIFTLNVANTMATALDFLATNPEKRLHQLLVVLIFFSVGSLMYSVSSTVFSRLLVNLETRVYTWYHVVMDLFGVLLGVALIWLLMVVEARVEKKAHEAETVDNVATANDVLVPMRESLDREQLYLSAARSSTFESEDYKEKLIEHYTQRVGKITEVIQSFESVQNLTSLVKMPVTEDAREVVEDSLYSQLGVMEDQYLLAPKGKTKKKESLNRRAVQLLLIMGGLLVVSVLLTFAFTPLFAFLDETNGTIASLLNAFAEGLSGGAFLATISSTMIPRIQQDAYRSHWPKFKFHSIGMFAFVAGMVFSVLLDVINVGTNLPPLTNITLCVPVGGAEL